MGNLPRVLPAGVRAELDWDAWERPPVFAWLAEQGVEEDELRRVFNCGVGICAVVPCRRRRRRARDRQDRGRVIGVLVSGEGTNLQALLDAQLPVVAVASSRQEARALERAEAAKVAAAAFPLAGFRRPRAARPDDGELAPGAGRRG